MTESVRQDLNILIPAELKRFLETTKTILRDFKYKVEIDKVESFNPITLNTVVDDSDYYSGKPLLISINGVVRISEKKEKYSKTLDLKYSCESVSICYDTTNRKLIVNDLGKIDFFEKSPYFG